MEKGKGEPLKMYASLFIVLFLGIFAGVSLLFYKLKVSPIFIWTNIVLGTIFLSISVLEAALRPDITYPDIPQQYMVALWGIITVTATCIPFIFYLAFKYENRDLWSGKEALFLGILVVGCYLFYGAMEDFCCFVIWGLEYLNPTDAYWITSWIGGIVPTHYVLLGAPGIVLIGHSVLAQYLRSTK